jgi:hypothetical protein
MTIAPAHVLLAADLGEEGAVPVATSLMRVATPDELRVYGIDFGGWATLMSEHDDRGEALGEIAASGCTSTTRWSRAFGRKLADQVAAETPGRGITADGILFQTALPRLEATIVPGALGDAVLAVATELADRWDGARAPAVRTLPTRLDAAESEIYVLVDDYDLVASVGRNPLSALGDLAVQARDASMHVVLARASSGAARASMDPVISRVVESRRSRDPPLRRPERGTGRPRRPCRAAATRTGQAPVPAGAPDARPARLSRQARRRVGVATIRNSRVMTPTR